MSNVSFPASHLSSFDIGQRIMAISTTGAKITDTLTRLVAAQDADGNTTLRLFFKNATPSAAHTHGGRGIDDFGFPVNPDQMVKRVYK